MNYAMAWYPIEAIKKTPVQQLSSSN